MGRCSPENVPNATPSARAWALEGAALGQLWLVVNQGFSVMETSHQGQFFSPALQQSTKQTPRQTFAGEGKSYLT